MKNAAYARRPAGALLGLIVTAAFLSGCGSGANSNLRSGSPASADDQAVAVIKAWSSTLGRGDVHGAALLFANPSEFVNGGGSGQLDAVKITGLASAEAANEALPCGAQFVSAARRGRYINALFRLTGRPGPGGSSCGGAAGQTARTDFIIEHGRIVVWLRAADDPGDNGSAPNGQSPPTPEVSGPVV